MWGLVLMSPLKPPHSCSQRVQITQECSGHVSDSCSCLLFNLSAFSLLFHTDLLILWLIISGGEARMSVKCFRIPFVKAMTFWRTVCVSCGRLLHSQMWLGSEQKVFHRPHQYSRILVETFEVIWSERAPGCCWSWKGFAIMVRLRLKYLVSTMCVYEEDILRVSL